MSDRKLCMMCNTNPRAINYKTEDKIYYRSLCDPCIRVKRKGQTPRWIREGYKKRRRGQTRRGRVMVERGADRGIAERDKR